MIMLVLFLVYMTGLVLCAIDYTRQTGFEELKQMVIDCNKTANARTAELVISGNGAIAILLDIDYEFVEEATDKMFRCLGNEGFGIPIGQKLNGWRDIFVSDTYSMEGLSHLIMSGLDIADVWISRD